MRAVSAALDTMPIMRSFGTVGGKGERGGSVSASLLQRTEKLASILFFFFRLSLPPGCFLRAESARRFIVQRELLSEQRNEISICVRDFNLFPLYISVPFLRFAYQIPLIRFVKFRLIYDEELIECNAICNANHSTLDNIMKSEMYSLCYTRYYLYTG